MNNIFHLRFLGPVQVEQDGEPLRGFRSRKALALLGYLVAQGQVLPREHLADLFWEDQPESRGRANLSWVLNKLKALLPDCLETDRHTVRFRRAAPYWLDVDAFEELEARGETGALAEAVELYRGEFLQGLYLEGCAEFELWVLAERERWHQRVLRALETLVAHRSRHGEYEASLHFARRLLALEPWREETHRQVMRLLAWSGQRGAALAQYENCRRVLAAELGVEPALETTALYERISTANSARRHDLPAQPTPFVNREEELTAIVKLLDDPDSRLLTILGPGGIGKTRLALQAGEARREAFLEGVHFVPLVALSSDDFLASAIADALQFSLSGSGDPQLQLLDYLRGKQVLLILDNFEQLIPPSIPPTGEDGGGVELLGEILEKAPEVKLLVTSRERLNLRWERCFEIAGLDYPGATPPDAELQAYSAVQLFQHMARQVRQDFALSEQDRPAVARICQLVEGLPLGIELAAAWAGAYTCQEISGEIERGLDFLATSLRDVPPRHRSVQATFEHSWRLLTPPEHGVLMALSVFRRGFQREAAQAVAGAAPMILKSLVDKSLLRFLPSGRYEMHEMLRQYAADKLRRAEKLAAFPEVKAEVHDRHCAHYAAFLESQEANLIGAGAPKALAAIRAEIGNVRAAWRWAVKKARLEEIEQGLDGLSRYYLLTGPLQEGERFIGMAVDCVRTLFDQRGQSERDVQIVLSKLLAEQARFLNQCGMYAQAIAAAQEAIDQTSLVGETDQAAHLEAAGYLRLGQALLYQGELETAQAQLKQALALAQCASLSQVEADSLNSAGLACYNQGDYARARDLLAQALPIYQQVEDRRGESASLNNLGLISSAQGDYGEAKAYFEQVLHACREIGDRQNEGVVLHNLGRILVQQGEYVAARAHLEQALRIYRSIGNRRGEGWGLLNLGRVALEQGNCAATRDYCRQALRVFCDIGARRGESLALINLGSAWCQQGDYNEAAACSERALLICREVGARLEEGWALSCLGDVFDGQGDYGRARVYFEQALCIYCEIGAREAEGWGLAALSLLYHHLGDDGAAREHGQRALVIAQELENHSLQGCALTNLGHALVSLGRLSDAAEAYQQALVLRRGSSQPHLATESLAGLARVSLGLGELTQAQDQVEEILSHLESGTPSPGSGHRLGGIDEPLRIYLTCYRALHANQDPRAKEILSTAHNLLQERAAKIGDEELRRSLLENVAVHREIVEEALKAKLA